MKARTLQSEASQRQQQRLRALEGRLEAGICKQSGEVFCVTYGSLFSSPDDMKILLVPLARPFCEDALESRLLAWEAAAKPGDAPRPGDLDSAGESKSVQRV